MQPFDCVKNTGAALIACAGGSHTTSICPIPPNGTSSAYPMYWVMAGFCGRAPVGESRQEASKPDPHKSEAVSFGVLFSRGKVSWASGAKTSETHNMLIEPHFADQCRPSTASRGHTEEGIAASFEINIWELCEVPPTQPHAPCPRASHSHTQAAESAQETCKIKEGSQKGGSRYEEVAMYNEQQREK